MRKSLQCQILASVLAIGILGVGNTVFAANDGITDKYETFKPGDMCYVGKNGSSNNKVFIDENLGYGVAGGYDSDGSNGAIRNIVTVKDTEVGGHQISVYTYSGNVYGGYSKGGDVSCNKVEITNSILKQGDVFGGSSSGSGEVSHNRVAIKGESQVLRNESQGGGVWGGSSASGLVTENFVEISGGFIESCVYGGKSTSGEVISNHVTISGNTVVNDTVDGGYSLNGNADSNEVNISGGTIYGNIHGGLGNNASNNTVSINMGNIDGSVYGGFGHIDNPYNNEVNISGGTINGAIYGGFGFTGADDNSVNISGSADIANADLYGANKTGGTGNTLTIDNWSGSTKSVQSFNTINFDNIGWKNGATVLDITANQKRGALAGTEININNIAFQGGTQLSVGESMTFIRGNDLQINKEEVNADDTFTAGVVIGGTGQVAADGNSVTYTLTSVKHLDQIDLVAENRAVAAAFVNQGTDLISDSMDTLSRDGKYGVKTFAAVHGNRSKYDVNSDIKINGWSSIVGVGNEKNVGNGDFSWGVFYENGSGNYRTYNEFNNEFFRGDGSLVYNGGGIAARYEQDNGVYTEGSLRAGMLKSEMSNALKDGAGNNYGYKSESSYYGAHLGVGKVIALDDNKDLDIYGKFFHTYTDGDSFTVAGDKFEFDSITSDRLRIGARLTTNKENKVSTYYGLAYEYEFNGDAQMRAQNMSAPEQSLQGSSYMAEVGMNYQPDEDSPWSFDLNMRGYAGEREGASFNVQATYTF